MEPLSSYWKSRVVAADGAMGTLLFARRGGEIACIESLDLDEAALVEQAHDEYIAAGAQLLESNTFAANRLKLTRFDLEDRLDEINRAGVEIARRASSGKAYVAGSIGPLGGLLEPFGHVSGAEAHEIFREHAAALAAASPDLLLLETFGGADEAAIAVRAAREAAPSVPLLISLSVLDDGRTPDGDELLPSFQRLLDAGADAVGLNCAVGPHAVFDAIAPIIGELSCPVSVMPNAGFPRRIDDETVYGSSPEYFARFARAFVEIGVTIVGGCCGTTPAHVAAMAAAIAGKPTQRRRPQGARISQPTAVVPARVVRRTPPAVTATTDADLRSSLGARFVVTVEMSPPRGVDLDALIGTVRALADAGADAVHVTDNPTARLRMSGAAAAHVIMRETGVPAILHVSCRDRNLLGLQSDLLGAAALGIPAVVALTGDPSNVGDFPKATSVFDVTALGLTRIVRDLNEGRDHGGAGIDTPTRFRIGTLVNPLPRDLAAEIARFDEKVSAGADFALTQPVFDPAPLTAFLDRARDRRVPVIVSLLPLSSHDDTEYLCNEVPGITIPEAVRERMRTARDGWREGVAIARELLAGFKQTPGIAGVCVVSQERYDLASEVIAP